MVERWEILSQWLKAWKSCGCLPETSYRRTMWLQTPFPQWRLHEAAQSCSTNRRARKSGSDVHALPSTWRLPQIRRKALVSIRPARHRKDGAPGSCGTSSTPSLTSKLTLDTGPTRVLQMQLLDQIGRAGDQRRNRVWSWKWRSLDRGFLTAWLISGPRAGIAQPDSVGLKGVTGAPECCMREERTMRPAKGHSARHRSPSATANWSQTCGTTRSVPSLRACAPYCQRSSRVHQLSPSRSSDHPYGDQQEADRHENEERGRSHRHPAW